MFEIRVLEADPGCKGSGIRGRVLGIHSLMHVFSDLSQVTLLSGLATGTTEFTSFCLFDKSFSQIQFRDRVVDAPIV